MNATQRRTLVDLFAVQSESGKESAMLTHMRRALRNAGCRIVATDSDGQFLAMKGNTDAPVPYFIAHADTVHAIVPKSRYALGVAIADDGDIEHYAYDPTTGASRGIGGDDKVGLWACIEAAWALPDVAIIITVQEERGGLGALALNPGWLDDAAVLIQLDRRGNADAVRETYDHVSSPEWQEHVAPILATHGYAWSDGALTDVVVLAEEGISPVSVVNLSAGYHLPHTVQEYVSERDASTALALALALARASAGRAWLHTMEVEPSYAQWGGWGGSVFSSSSGQSDAFGRCASCGLRDELNDAGYCGDCMRFEDSRHAADDSCPGCGALAGMACWCDADIPASLDAIPAQCH